MAIKRTPNSIDFQWKPGPVGWFMFTAFIILYNVCALYGLWTLVT